MVHYHLNLLIENPCIKNHMMEEIDRKTRLQFKLVAARIFQCFGSQQSSRAYGWVEVQCRLRGDFAFQGHNCQVKERKLAQEHIYLLLLGPHAPSLCTGKVFINSIMTLVCLFAFMVGADQKNSRQAGKVQPKKHHLNRVKDKTSSIFEEDIYLHLQTYSNNI